MALSLIAAVGCARPVFAQQGGGAYGAGQIVGVILLLLLIGAILWRVLKR